MPKSTELRPKQVLEHRYEVNRLLASGSTTRVYEGRHVGLDQPVVVKQLKELYPDSGQAAEQAQQFQLEARLLARLRHPNLVQVYDTFLVDGVPVLVMEMVDGRNLDTVVNNASKHHNEDLVLKWGNQLVNVLQYLHSQSPPIIVRGLQPSNVMLDQDNNLRLIDFGLAKHMDEKGAGTRNIVKGLGEDGFASLEQNAYSKTDARSDIYSLGALLYYLLTKDIPPSSPQRVVAPTDPLTDPRRVNPTVSVATWEAIQKMMALRANERPATVGEVQQLLPTTAPRATEGKRLCVDCREVLKTEQFEDVEVDVCAKCGGMWLDEGELEQLRKTTAELEERAEEFAKTIALPSDHPALKLIDNNEVDNRPFWSTVLEKLKLRAK